MVNLCIYVRYLAVLAAALFSPSRWSSGADGSAVSGFRDDAAAMCGVSAFNVRSECKQCDWLRLLMIITLKQQNGIRFVYSRG